jgi:hypothetical protein
LQKGSFFPAAQLMRPQHSEQIRTPDALVLSAEVIAGPDAVRKRMYDVAR